MGYDLHITRAPVWTDSEFHPISRDAWLAYVAQDPEVGPDPENGPDDFLYLAHPVEPKPLWQRQGEIYTKNPDDEMIAKLCVIAAALDARVQGDHEEYYCR